MLGYLPKLNDLHYLFKFYSINCIVYGARQVQDSTTQIILEVIAEPKTETGTIGCGLR
jgi:hypothetical protein